MKCFLWDFVGLPAAFIQSFSEESVWLLFGFDCSLPNSLCNYFWVLFIFYPRISDNFWSICIVPFWSLQKLYQFRAFIQSSTEVSDWLLIDLNNFLNLAFWLIALYCFSVSYFALLLIIYFKTSLTSHVTCYFAWVFRIGFLFCLAASFQPTQPFFRSNCLNSLVHSLIHLQYVKNVLPKQVKFSFQVSPNITEVLFAVLLSLVLI